MKGLFGSLAPEDLGLMSLFCSSSFSAYDLMCTMLPNKANLD